ncbi:hypothetical protein F4825DRAFT_450159 [Nemania diffusa]|nr:hypothetical protein F4825DRAFT_450159 [Nemania diffusa]
MQLFVLKAATVAAILQTTSASPMWPRADGIHVISTTTTADGQVIDWAIPESQTGGKIAQPPPVPSHKHGFRSQQAVIRALFDNNKALQGPNGTVPIPRLSGTTKSIKRFPTKEDNESFAKIDAASNGYAGKHWYANSGQSVVNYGGEATFSLFEAFTNKNDFSLIQTAIYHDTPHAGIQTIEAGWINFPGQAALPHLFTYFTTSGYSKEGDNVGGWNREHKGWVQVDPHIYPGVAFAPLSARGGIQHEADIGYILFAGNWWLWCMGRYIGYYPGAMFAQDGVAAADTLADHAVGLNFYGEIFNGEAALTTTDMGSGEWPDTGLGRSAYMHNIVYIDGNNKAQEYNGQAATGVSDASRYNLITNWSSGTKWGSYMYLGGPGAGGKINA